MDLAINIEAQQGLTWPRWQRLAQAVEDFGFAGLYRSDHFTDPDGPYQDSLELWTALTWLASHTRRIEFGPLVTPVSFRHPVFTARMALAVDDLSQGRLRLGVGAGWQEREHRLFGFDLLDLPDRMERFEESLEVLCLLMRQDEPANFDGRFYHLEDAQLLPRPQRRCGPPLVIGGNGIKITLPLAARYANEWNGVFLPAARFAELNARLTELVEEQGRSADSVRRTLMTNITFGRDDADLKAKLGGKNRADWLTGGSLVGTGSEIIDQLGKLHDSGVQRVMLQWLDQTDIDGLEALAKITEPYFR
jgi:F420-dependent oxidoreductase-like protein